MNREVNEDLIQKLKARVRAMSKAAEDEIKDLVLSCRKELGSDVRLTMDIRATASIFQRIFIHLH